jgi:hypothetical protein
VAQTHIGENITLCGKATGVHQATARKARALGPGSNTTIGEPVGFPVATDKQNYLFHFLIAFTIAWLPSLKVA